MSSRVVGRGICSKCGKPGSLVLKRIGDRVYVYFKHGSKWCYIGPIGKVKPDELLEDVEPRSYHILTTKYSSSLSKTVGCILLDVRGRLTVLLSLLTLAFALSINNMYSVIVLSLTAIAIIVYSSLLASYEMRFRALNKYGFLAKLFKRSFIGYSLISFITFLGWFSVGLLLRSPIVFTFTVGIDGYTLLKIPLTAFMVSAMVLTLFAYPPIRYGITVRSIILLLLVPLTSFIWFYTMPAIKYGILATIWFLGLTLPISEAIVLGFVALIWVLKRIFQEL